MSTSRGEGQARAIASGGSLGRRLGLGLGLELELELKGLPTAILASGIADAVRQAGAVDRVSGSLRSKSPRHARRRL